MRRIVNGAQTEASVRFGSGAVTVALVALIYFVAARLSLSLAIPPGYATPVWPPSGIALAAVLLCGPRVWPGVWVGAALVNLSIQGSPLLALAIATGNTLEMLAAATLVRPCLGRHWRFDSGEDVIKFVGWSALCASIGATIGVAALALSNVIGSADFFAHAWTWWQGDASGMIIVTPLILSWSARPSWRWQLPRVIESVALAIAVALTTLFLFGGIGSDGTPVTLAFIALPLLIWAAVRFSQREVTTAVALICAIAVWYAIQGRAPFGAENPNASLLFLLAYISTLVVTGLVLCAVIGERERAVAQLLAANEQLGLRVDDRTLEVETINRALREELAERVQQEEVLRQSEERFRLLVDGAKDYAIFMLDPSGNVVSWNTGAHNIYLHSPTEIVGRHFSLLYTPEDIVRGWPDHELDVARAEGRYEEEGWRRRKDDTRFWASVIVSAFYDREHRLRGFVKVTRDLTVRRRVEILQENERQMNEFLAMLSHELRNPLGSIATALDLMRHKSITDRSEARAIIERQVAHLSRIVDDLLDVGRIIRGKVDLRKEILSVKDIVVHTVQSSKSTLLANQHTVDLDLSEDDLYVDGDPTRLSQVILNLFNNAVKYTPTGGRISVSVQRDEDDVVLSVRDTGIGIPPALLPTVFDLFVQGDRSLDRSAGGLGIGLTVVRRMVEMHGGSVSAMSQGAGEGSEFVVRLPRVAARPVADTPPFARPLGQGHGTRRRLFIVDDNRDFVSSLSALLEEFGHDVRNVHDGRAALAAAADFGPDVVLLDIGLPGMDGYEIARRLRMSERLRDATLIGLSGYGQEEDRRRARDAGFDHYLVKPIDVTELMNIIDALPVNA